MEEPALGRLLPQHSEVHPAAARLRIRRPGAGGVLLAGRDYFVPGRLRRLVLCAGASRGRGGRASSRSRRAPGRGGGRDTARPQRRRRDRRVPEPDAEHAGAATPRRRIPVADRRVPAAGAAARRSCPRRRRRSVRLPDRRRAAPGGPHRLPLGRALPVATEALPRARHRPLARRERLPGPDGRHTPVASCSASVQSPDLRERRRPRLPPALARGAWCDLARATRRRPWAHTDARIRSRGEPRFRRRAPRPGPRRDRGSHRR